MKCVICDRRGRDRESDEGRTCCRACAVALRADLAAIVEAAAIAAVLPDPYATRGTGGGARPKPGSRPPLDVAHIDPELVSVEAVKGDRSSAEPLLVLLESWCRAVREDRGWVRYGQATEGVPVTLAAVCGWLAGQVEWMTETPDFDVEGFADHVRRGLGALRALDPATERTTRWTVPCPADVPAIA